MMFMPEIMFPSRVKLLIYGMATLRSTMAGPQVVGQISSGNHPQLYLLIQWWSQLVPQNHVDHSYSTSLETSKK